MNELFLSYIAGIRLRHLPGLPYFAPGFMYFITGADR